MTRDLWTYFRFDEYTIVWRQQSLTECAIELEHLHRVYSRVDDEQISLLVGTNTVRTQYLKNSKSWKIHFIRSYTVLNITTPPHPKTENTLPRFELKRSQGCSVVVVFQDIKIGTFMYLPLMMCSHCPTPRLTKKWFVQNCVKMFILNRNRHQHRFPFGSVLI